MSRLLFITAAFPYLPGEQFIEAEISQWGKQNHFKVTVLPLSCYGEKRVVPTSVCVDMALAVRPRISLLASLLALPFYHVIYKEIYWVLVNKVGNVKAVVASILEAIRYATRCRLLNRYLRDHGPFDVIYCYWNNASAYAAADAKRRGLVKTVVSRIHRSDLYEERKESKHLPFKRIFINDFSRIYCLSETAKEYLVSTFNAERSNVEVARLGVPIPRWVPRTSYTDQFCIVSCSFCVPVKRIDKIIAAVARLSAQDPSLRIKWTHIGGGALLAELTEKARTMFTNNPNIEWAFLGMLDNLEVHSFYEKNPVHVFINMSESEGIPVSIMESMAFGNPAIAPDVGGINTLINNKNGRLLSPCATVEEAVAALKHIYNLYQLGSFGIRRESYDTVNVYFNSERNYVEFIDHLAFLAGKAHT